MSDIKKILTNNSAAFFGRNTNPNNNEFDMNVPSSSAAALMLSNNSSNSASPELNKKTVAGSSETIRLELELFEPNSKTFPQYNYAKVLLFEKKKQRKIKQKQENVIADPFEDNDDDVIRIAREMELKYKSCYGRGKTNNNDKALGYDGTDTFIDDTEAYDEKLPEHYEPKETGFYINCGKLEFTCDLETEEMVKMVKNNNKKKRVFSTSSEDSEKSSESESECIESIEENDGVISTDEKSKKFDKQKLTKSNKNGHSDKKVKLNQEESDNKTKKPKIKVITKLSEEPIPNPNILDNANGGNGTSKEKNIVKTTTVKDMLKARRDSFLKMQDNKTDLKLNGVVKTSSNDETTTSSSSSEAEYEPSEKKNKSDAENDNLHTGDVKLSDNISVELIETIKLLIDTAISGNRLGKSFQFDEKYTEMFIKIDDMIDDKTIRTQIFSYLEFHLSLTKNYLGKRAKQIRMKFEKNKTKKAYMKLKKSVNEMMPQIIQNYDKEYRKITEQRNAIPPDELAKMENPPKFPKKKFPWNDTISNLLYDVYQKRWTSYSVFRSRKESFEDFIKNYLKQELVLIWPIGWMRYEEIRKEIEKRKNASATNKIKPKTNSEPSKIVASADLKLSKPVSSVTILTTKDLLETLPTDKLNNGSNLIKQANQNDIIKPITIKTAKIPATSVPTQNDNKFPKSTQNPSTSKASTKNDNNMQVINIALSPKKTDHSITKLISPSKDLNSQSSTHIITVDNFINTNDIIQTSNKIIQNTSNNNQVKELSSKEYKNFNSRRNTLDSISSADSDCIVISPIKQKNHNEEKLKYIKSENIMRSTSSSLIKNNSNINNNNKNNNNNNNNNSSNNNNNININNKNKINMSNEKESLQYNIKSVSSSDRDSDLDVNYVTESFQDFQRVQQKFPSKNQPKINIIDKVMKEQ